MGDLSRINPVRREMVLPFQEPLVIACRLIGGITISRGNRCCRPLSAMSLLARRMQTLDTGFSLQTLDQVRFPKFLAIDPAKNEIQALCDISSPREDQIRLALATRTTSRSGAISRTVEHAAALFSRDLRPQVPDAFCLEQSICLSGPPLR